MDSPLLRTIVQSARLAARSVHETSSFLHDDDDFQQPDGRKRPRPGVVGRPDYRKSYFASQWDVDEGPEIAYQGKISRWF